MRNSMFLWAVAATVALTSCSKESVTNITDTKPAAQFTAGITSRAQNASWAAGDAIGVFMKRAGAPLSVVNIAESVSNFKYVTAANDGKFTAIPAQTAYFPVDGSAVDFIAYYPYKANITNFSYPIDVSDQGNMPAIDALYTNNATGKTKAAPNVELRFEHKLSYLVVNLLPGVGLDAPDVTGASVKISGQRSLGSMALATGAIIPSSTQSATQSIALAKKSTSGEAIILPATAMAGRKLIITITTDEVFEWEIPYATVFESGKKYIYNATLDRTKVTVQSTITDWTAGNGTGGEDVGAGQPNL